MTSPSRPRRWPRFVALSLSLSALLLSVTLPTALAAHVAISTRGGAPTATDRDLNVPNASVTTTTGKKLSVNVDAKWLQIAKDTATVTIGLFKTTAKTINPFESHNWEFILGQSSFSSSSNNAKIDLTSKQIGWYGQVALTFTAASRKSGSCSSGSETIYTGTITGSIHFNTNKSQNSGWGSVIDQRVSWPNSRFTVSFDCFSNISLPPGACLAGFLWSSPSQDLGGISSQQFGGSDLQTPGGKSMPDTINLLRSGVSSKVNGTTVLRDDSATDLSPPQKLNTSIDKVTITGGSKSSPPGGTLITGNAQLVVHVSTAPKPNSYGSCTESGKKKNQCATTYIPVGGHATSSWTNGAPPLTAHLSIGGSAMEPSKPSNSGFDGGYITVFTIGGCKAASTRPAAGSSILT
jgi:hypothetical protein